MWYKLFIAVVNRHAPIRHKRVKHSKLTPWLNKNIIQVISDRDRLKKERMFTEYKTARNEVEKLVRNAKKNFFRRPTLDRRKFRIISQLMHLMTTFCPLQKP